LVDSSVPGGIVNVLTEFVSGNARQPGFDVTEGFLGLPLGDGDLQGVLHEVLDGISRGSLADQPPVEPEVVFSNRFRPGGIHAFV